MTNLYTTTQRSGAVAATHSGSFHADDVFAAALLRLANPSLPIWRTRDPKQLDTADIVFDVGRVFDAATCRFDHHQLGYTEARDNGIPFSSFGLVWREMGTALCGSEAAAARVDRWLVQGVDALDCGINLHKESPSVSVMSVSSVISGFNPAWQDDTSEAAKNMAFERAVGTATVILQNMISDASGREAVRAIVAQGQVLEAGRLLVLDKDVPWQESVLSSPQYARLVYVISPDSQTKWHINTIPNNVASFTNRKPLPSAWAGLDGEELDAVTGLSGCVFCHKACFVAAHTTQDGAMAMARLALGSDGT